MHNQNDSDASGIGPRRRD